MDTILTGQEDGLVAYFTFNEGAGDTLHDQTGNGHHGIIMGGPSWVDGYTLSALLGDVNFDEILNIQDAVMLVAIMLNHEQGTELQLNSCDINQDGVIDIEDIVLLFQWILDIDVNSRSEISTGQYHVSEDLISISSDGDIAGFQISLSDQNVEIDLFLPSGWTCKRDGKKLVAYGIDGSSLPNNFSFQIEEPKYIQSMKLAGWGKTSVNASMVNIPDSFMLKTSPNPFNPGCRVSFEINETSNVDISLYDIRGKHLGSIKNGQFTSGMHKFYWEPTQISSGTYFLKINDGKNSQHKKIIYLK